MFDGLGSFVQAALGIIAIASLAGVALQRANVKGLRERLDDYDKEVAEKDRRLTDAELEIAKLHALNETQKHDLEALGRVVTGEAHWEAVTSRLEEIEHKLSSIHDAIRGPK